MKFLQVDQPLWLPRGSVRALLSFALIVGMMFNVVPIEIASAVVVFYFSQRGNEASK
jgi:hypothetical protein